jgi:hypothetical protein
MATGTATKSKPLTEKFGDEETQPGTDVSEYTSRPPAAIRPEIAVPATFAEAMDAFGDAGVIELEQEWKLVDKEQLVGIPFLIHSFRFSHGVGENGEKVSVQIITPDDKRLVFNDGSTGVYDQLLEIFEGKGRSGGVLCERGLRVSDYYYDPKGRGDISKEPKTGYEKGSTYYIA